MAADQRLWTDEEVETLRRLYPKMKSRLIATQLDRSPKSVQHKAQQLKIPGLTTYQTPWTDTEKEVLRSLYGVIPANQIATFLDRTYVAVIRAIKRMGLEKRSKKITRSGMPAQGRLRKNSWTMQEDQLLRELYPSKRRKELQEMLGRSAQAIYARAFQLQITNKYQRGLQIGDERLNSHGLLVRKISNTGNQWKDYKRVDVIDWEAINGPVPAGLVLARVNPFLPRTPDNLALFTKQELKDRVFGLQVPPEVKELISLRRQIMNELKKDSESPSKKSAKS